MTAVGSPRHAVQTRARIRALRQLAVLSALSLAVALVVPALGPRAFAAGPCGPPVASVIACENTQPGDPPSDWKINGAGDPSIQGFATTMSVNAGTTVTFKVSTT